MNIIKLTSSYPITTIGLIPGVDNQQSPLRWEKIKLCRRQSMKNTARWRSKPLWNINLRFWTLVISTPWSAKYDATVLVLHKTSDLGQDLWRIVFYEKWKTWKSILVFFSKFDFKSHEMLQMSWIVT